MERETTARRCKRAVFATLALLSFLLMLGTVGAMEHDTVPLLEGTIRSFVLLSLLALFTYLAGGFYGQQLEGRPNNGSNERCQGYHIKLPPVSM